MPITTRNLRATLFFAVTHLATSCGGSDFAGGGSTASNPGKPSDNSDADAKVGNGLTLNWSMSCDSKPSKLTKSDTGYDLTGVGPHRIPIAAVNGARIQMRGSACGANTVTRDVIFVIDVSGSMGQSSGIGGLFSVATDPLRNGTCARMQALDKVIGSIKENGAANFGIVTFNGDEAPKKSSSRLFDNIDDLYADLQGNASSIANVICAASGGTNYDSGLHGAQTLIKNFGDKGHAKEVYFVSDGVPEPSSANGKVIAAELRKTTTIATIMIGSTTNDDILKNNIASKDRFAAPLHARAEHADNLAEVLQRLVNNNIVEAKAIIRGSNDTLKSVDFSKKLKGLNFNFLVYEINTSDVPQGLTVELEYHDRFGQKHLDVGTLQWVEDAPEKSK